MLTVSRREGNVHQLVLVVLVAKGGNCIFRGLFVYSFFFRAAGSECERRKLGVDTKSGSEDLLQRARKHGERVWI